MIKYRVDIIIIIIIINEHVYLPRKAELIKNLQSREKIEQKITIS